MILIIAQGDLHEQLKSSKKDAKESGESRNKAEAELEELRDRVEEMALDKEMAEEMKECAELGESLNSRSFGHVHRKSGRRIWLTWVFNPSLFYNRSFRTGEDEGAT